MSMINYFDVKYDGEFKELKNNSTNRHFYGYSNLYNEEVFIKCIEQSILFQSEVAMTRFLYPDRLLDTGEIKNIGFILYRWMDLEELIIDQRNMFYELGIKLAKFHMEAEQRCGFDFDSKISKKIKELFNKLPPVCQHIISDSTMSRFYLISDYIDAEYQTTNSTIIHGDFGLRNVKLFKSEIVLLDFERCRRDIAWMDLIKFFNREANTPEKKKRFLIGYRCVKELPEPSHQLKMALILYEAMGILKYTLTHKNTMFFQMAVTMLNSIKE